MKTVNAVLALLPFAVFPIHAQSVRGAIVGRVTDGSDKPVPMASITFVDEETNRERALKTDRQGQFAVTMLPPGEYRIEASAPGFRASTRTVNLLVNQEVNIEVPLLPERLNEQVNVTAQAGVLNTDSAAMSDVFQNRQIVDLPLDGRNFYALTLLIPGSAPAAQGSAGSDRGDFTFNVDGAREDANNYLLDGVYNGDPKLNGFSVAPPVDAVREYEVIISTSDATFGRSAGAQINVVLKSGTNNIHGTVYEFFRNADLDATNYFALKGVTAPADIRNQFGASFGAPIKKNKTFVFADYEGWRIRDGIVLVTNVPTAAERVGDFSHSTLVPIDVYTGLPFPGNIIPQNRLDPIALKIAALYPLPNQSTPGQNYVGSPVQKDDNDHFDIRLDHNINRSTDLSFHYSFGNRSYYEPYGAPGSSAEVPGYGNNVPRTSQNVMFGLTHTFAPTLVNEIRLGYDRISLQVNQQNQDINVNSAVGLPTPSANPRDQGLSEIVVSGFATLGDEINNPQSDTANVYQIVDSASWAHGSHLLQFGFDIRDMQQNAFADVESRGLIEFTGYTGNALAEMLQDALSDSALGTLNNPQHLRTRSYDFYAQDKYRVRPNLTLTLGLRYEYNSPAVDAQNRATLYNAATGTIVPVGQNGVPRAGYNPDYNNFAPRLGIAWTPGSAGKWVVRTGYGIYYDQTALSYSEGLYFSPPYFISQIFIPSQQLPVVLEDPFPANFPQYIPNSGFTYQRNLRTPYVQQWNFGIQREVTKSSFAELSYVGSKGTKLIDNRDINQANASPQQPNLRPNPAFADIDAYESRGNSNYNALQVRFTHRLHAGLTALASYVWSKSIDDASGFFSSAGDPNFPQNSNDTRADRGLSNFDIRQRFVASYTYDLPFPTKNRLLRGWQTNGVWTFQTGQPFTVTLQPGIDNSNTGLPAIGFGVVDRPNVVGNPKISNQTPAHWFNTAAFVTPPYGTFGNAGRNILEGPGFSSVDVSIFKTTKINEHAALQFRTEIFNLFNRPNFALPDSFVGDPSFGSILSAATPRRVQFALKILF